MPAKPCPEVPHLHVFFNTSSKGDSTTSLSSLFQCLTTLSGKKFFLISNPKLPWRNLRPLPLVPSLATWEKRPTPASLLVCYVFRTDLSLIDSHGCCSKEKFSIWIQVKRVSVRHYLQEGPNETEFISSRIFVPIYGFGTSLNFTAQETSKTRRKPPKTMYLNGNYFLSATAFWWRPLYFLVMNNTVQGTEFKIQHSQEGIIRTTQQHWDAVAIEQLCLLAAGSQI